MKQDGKRTRPIDIGLSLLVAGVLAAAVLMLRPTATGTSVIPAVTLPDPAHDPATAIVSGLSRSLVARARVWWANSEGKR